MLSKIFLIVLALALLALAALGGFITYDMFWVAQPAQFIDRVIGPVMVVLTLLAFWKLVPHLKQ